MADKPILNLDVMSHTFKVSNIELSQDKKATFLSADASAGGSTLTVKSIIGFSGSKILLVGEWGQEDTEIIKMSSATGTTITLASTLTYAHNQGTKVYLLDFKSSATMVRMKSSLVFEFSLFIDNIFCVFDNSLNLTHYN